MYTWNIAKYFDDANSEVAKINLTQTEAIQAAGPLTFLNVLTHAGANTELHSRVQAARATGKLTLHVIGINTQLEPHMAWKRYLCGPLREPEQRLVTAFNLPEAPFSNIHVSLVFNGFGHFADITKHPEQSIGYSETYAKGLYTNAVSTRPDVAFFMNPGFASEPELWWPVLCHLHAERVPMIVTGYGENMPAVYAHNGDQATPSWIGTTLLLPGDWSLVNTEAMDNRLLVQRYEQKAVKGRVGATAMVAHAETALGPLQPSHPVCGDEAGTFFMAERTDLAVRLATNNPFIYCDYPLNFDCNSNAMLFLLEPAEGRHIACKTGVHSRFLNVVAGSVLAKDRDTHAPRGIFKELLLDELQCACRQDKLDCAHAQVPILERKGRLSGHINDASDLIQEKCTC